MTTEVPGSPPGVRHSGAPPHWLKSPAKRPGSALAAELQVHASEAPVTTMPANSRPGLSLWLPMPVLGKHLASGLLATADQQR